MYELNIECDDWYGESEWYMTDICVPDAGLRYFRKSRKFIGVIVSKIVNCSTVNFNILLTRCNLDTMVNN